MRGFFVIMALCAFCPAGESSAASFRGPDTPGTVFTDVSPSSLRNPEIPEKTVSVDEDGNRIEKIDSVVVVASRAGENTPVTYTMIGRDELIRTNPVNSLPMNLSLQPSVISTNEGGTGLGYSKMTVRGSKGSQINVTLNGITLNDSESQEVFWVNIPSLSALLSSVQLQRGLGTSANGAGAFGASVNMSTASVGSRPFATADFGFGSYGTFTSAVAAGTGLTKSGVYFNAAYSRNFTDGYIRNAKADVQSAMAVLGWMNGSNSLKLTWLMGKQCTGITWNGIDLATYARDRRYNSAGEHYDYARNPDGSYILDSEGKRIVNSTLYYDNETDNYTQHHLQLNYTHQFANALSWSTTFNFTKGDGWYDQYKTDKKFKKYGLAAYAPAGFATSDFIINKCMDNSYYVLRSDLKWKSDLLDIVGGLSWSRYDGGHFGKVLWSDVLGTDWQAADGMTYEKFNANRLWYLNSALKQEYNAYIRGEYSPLDWFTAYVDLQLRDVNLKMWGSGDEAGVDMAYGNNWLFFNPRAGVTFHRNGHRAYISAAQGHREPGRPDIKENIEAGSNRGVRPEEMVDVEFGYEWASPVFTAGANFYFMEYWDMLLETGRLSDTGYPIKDNVGRAFRRGVEISAAYDGLRWFSVSGNMTLSLNRVLDYSESFQLYDDKGEAVYDADSKPVQKVVEFGNTTMLMSPSVIGMLRLGFRPFATISRSSLKTTTLSIDGKYVGKQYVDNTKNDSRSVPGWFVTNLALTHEFTLGGRHGSAFAHGGAIRLGLYVNNMLNNLYYVDGTVWYKGIKADGTQLGGIGIFPQAPANFVGKVSFSF